MDASKSNLYELNGKVPILQAVPFGLQHVLAMFRSLYRSFLKTKLRAFDYISRPAAGIYPESDGKKW